MKIEITEPNGILHGRERFESGDVRSVDDALGDYFCRMGWAKDVDGNVPTGERIVSKNTALEVPPNVHTTTGEVTQ